MVGALSAGSLVQAQSLAEAAEKEKARRKQQAGTAKVITQDDLAKSGKGTFSAPEGATEPTGTEAKADKDKDGKPVAEKAKDEKPNVDAQATWKEKVKQTQEAIGKLKESIAKFETSLADMSQNLYGGTRATAASQLEKSRASLAQAEATLADLQEEGRRNGW
jgi:hypothetical protein